MENNNKNYTKAGTDIEAVKKQNAASGMSYNEAKAWLAKNLTSHQQENDRGANKSEVRGKNQH